MDCAKSKENQRTIVDLNEARHLYSGFMKRCQIIMNKKEEEEKQIN